MPASFKSLRAAALRATNQKINNGEFTERQLATIAHMSQSHVHNVLAGHREGSIHILDKICKAAGIELTAMATCEEAGKEGSLL